MQQHGDQGRIAVAAGIQHHPFAFQIKRGAQPRVRQGDEDQGRLLKDLRQKHHRLAPKPGQQQPGIGHPVLGPSQQHLLNMAHAGQTLAQGYLQPLLGIEALLQCGVIAGKLKLMHPLELEGDRLQGRGGGQGAMP